MAAITLEELLKEVDLRPEKLDEPTSDKHLLEIALFLSSWRTVAPRLGLSEIDIDDVEREGKSEQEKRQRALQKWKHKLSRKATYRKLVEVSLSLGKADDADKICGLLKDPDEYIQPEGHVAHELLKKVEVQLTCSVCLESYKDPRLLQCFHVFCKECLERLVVCEHQGLFLSCPCCRQVILLPPGGVSGLQAAFHTNDLFEVRNALEKLEEPQKTQCEKCDEMHIATSFCRNCGQFVCIECTETHKKWKEFSSHEIVTIAQLRQDVKQLVPPKKKPMFCSKHPTKELDLYCETCEELICHGCTYRVHRDHQCDLVPDAFPKHKAVIVSSLQPVEQRLEIVNKALEQLDVQTQNIKGNREVVAEHISKAITNLQDLLEARKIELISQLDQITQQKLKTLAIQKDQMEMTQIQLTSCLDFMNARLQTDIQEEILAMKKPVIKQIKEITADLSPSVLVPQEHADMTFSGSSDLPPICQQFGQVKTYSVFPEGYYATGKGLEAAEVGKQATAIVHTMDIEGRECDKPLDSVKSELTSETDKVECKVEKKNSQYEISYQPTHKGKHQLSIKAEGMHIRGSPFTVVVIPMLGTQIKVIDGISQPWGVAVRDREIVVAEQRKHRVSIFAHSGEKIRTFGTEGSARNQFKYPHGVAFDSAGNILVVDRDNHRIKKLTAEGKFLTAGGSKGSGYNEFNSPVGIGINYQSKKVYVCDHNNHRVQILNEDLTFSGSIDSHDSSGRQLANYQDVAIDSAGSVYIADSSNHCISVFTRVGRFLRKFGKKGSGEGELNWPSSICVDSNDIVYVTEQDNHRISIFTDQGKFVRSFGNKGARRGEFNKPHGIAVDPNGRVYISDTFNNRVQIL